MNDPQRESLPDYINGIPRMVSIREFMGISGLSRDTVNRRAGAEVPPLVQLAPGKMGLRIDYVRAYTEGRRPWLEEE